MLDPNIATIVTTAITVIGTLGGVILGVVLTNRYTAKQEKLKRNTAIIEEVYTLITKVDKIVEDALWANELPDESMKDDLRRATTLVSLYTRSMKKDFHECTTSLWNLLDSKRGNLAPSGKGKPTLIESEEEIDDVNYNRYKVAVGKVLHGLETLVD